LRLFAPLVFITFFFVSLAGIVFFSTPITEEKEENTLGLLKMAGFSPVSILLGKSVARLASLVMLMLAQLPLTLLAVTLGGVSVIQIEAAYATLLAYTLFIGALGLLCSTVCRRSGGAAALTIGALLSYFLLPPILLGLAEALNEGRGPVKSWFYECAAALYETAASTSAFDRLLKILESSFTGPVIGVQVVTNLILAVALFAVAWWGFGVLTREDHDAAQARGLIPRKGAFRRLFGGGRAWKRALVWKDYHFMTGGRIATLVRFLLLAAIAGFIGFASADHYRGSPWFANVRYEEWGTAFLAVTLGLLYAELVLIASRVFGQEAKWKTLPDIMGLPVGLLRLGYGKVSGFLLALVPYPLFLLFAIGLCGTSQHFDRDFVEPMWHPAGLFAVFSAVAFLYLVAYFSLLLKHGGIFLAIALWVLSHLIVGYVAFSSMSFWSRSEDALNGLFIAMTLGMIGLIVLSHFLIAARLRRVAGEG
jgi:ABC-type transport system involved in multi-copper enzyme maturation permease subunit